ncbi:MAG: peptidoglycan DD-metalloendopeptidase family protein [Pseudomonadales bacterium]
MILRVKVNKEYGLRYVRYDIATTNRLKSDRLLMPQLQLWPLIFPVLFVLSSCFGGGHYAPVIERQERASVVPGTHTVVLGETLYSIAWHYSLDFRGLARTNSIDLPYTIYPGQTLRLKTRTLSVKTARTQPGSKASNPLINDPGKSPHTRNHHGSDRLSVEAFSIERKRYPFAWQWPAKGRMIRHYSSSSAVHKGIDIQGKLGEPVYSANSGKVVYAGSGLVGYGKLLIIKHDEQYLSAYGHNRELLVNEGGLVKVGQKIAEFGDTGTDKVKLHFEIRREGKPVNPLDLLPKR